MSEQFVVVVRNAPRDAEAVMALVRHYAPGPVGAVEVADRVARIACPDQARAEAVRRGLHGKNIKGQSRALQATVERAAPPAPPRLPAGPGAAAPAMAPGGRPAPPAGPLARPSPLPATVGRECSRPPFHFVPVLPEKAVTDGPVFHDRLDLGVMWSGEVRCTMKALTPLLAANDQCELRHAAPGVRSAFATMLRQRLGGAGAPKPDEDKKVLDKTILAPLCLPGQGQETPGAVLIGGAALKGMVRHSLSALLSAPMERVQERHFSYRPNVDLGRGDTGARLRTRAGLVTTVLPGGALRVRVLEFNDVTPVRAGAVEDTLRVFGGEAGWLERVGRLREARTPEEFNDRLGQLITQVPSGPRGSRPARRAVLPYRYGLDGEGAFNDAFNARHPEERREPYFHVGVDTRGRDGVDISAEVVAWWRETVRHLLSGDMGHLLRHPDLDGFEAAARAGLACLLAEGWRPGDVLYFEQEGERGRVVTMGHHFRYRWRYRDTVRTSRIREQRADALPPGGPEGLRAVLCPRPVELDADGEGRPKGLSAARLLFGYVGTRGGGYRDAEPTSAGVGLRADGKGGRVRCDFSQLAGRVAFNAAVEQGADAPPGRRFLNERHGFLVPLRPLGSPKPSAVEHYLDQAAVGARPDNGIVCTFGDDEADATAGDLLGRKFYLHQPMAALPGECSLYELLADGRRRRFQDEDMLAGNQAAVGLYVSRPEREFRFRMRFVNLREWELGALLFVLSPGVADLEAMAAVWGDAGGPLRRLLAARAGHGTPSRPLLAHKLGHGRPLGLGSVVVYQDAVLRLTKEEDLGLRDYTAARAGLVGAFAAWMKGRLGDGLAGWVECVLLRWLAVHQYAGRELESVEYPRATRESSASGGRGRRPAAGEGGPAAEEQTTFNYHANVRARHARGRKQQPPQGPRPRRGIQDLA